ncbi:IQ-DOMAIN 14-like protein [Tanacetum coccineum]
MDSQLAKRKRIIDFEKPPCLSRSYSFNSSLSGTRVFDAQDDKSLPPYDPIENYISPRPKYLRFNRDRHRKIFARQENVSRMIKAVSYDCGVSFLEEVSSDHCSIEEMKDLVKESLYLAGRNALSRIEDIEHLIEASQSIPLRRVDSKSPHQHHVVILKLCSTQEYIHSDALKLLQQADDDKTQARRALRALRRLVKLQALVRGFLVRKRVVATIYSMQALLRALLVVRSQRVRRSFKDHTVQPEIRHRKSTEKFDNDTRSEIHSRRLSTSYDSTTNSYNESPKIVGMDPYRPHVLDYVHV